MDGADGLRQVELPEPDAEGLVLVDIEYAGVAFPDLLQTKGMYQVRPDPPFVPGFEAAGLVRSAPPGSDLLPGTRVAVLSSGCGAWQNVMAAPEQNVFPLPDNVSTADGAGLLLNHLTGDFALRTRGRAVAGETLLVHGAAGGVGVSALRVGHALGLRTVAVVSEQAKVATAQRAGADHVVLTENWRDAVRERLGERPVDIVLDPVGGDRVTDSLRVLAPEGRLLVVGFTAGEIPTVKLNRLLLGNTGVIGVAWAEYVRHNPDYPRQQWRRMLPLLESGRLSVEPVTRYPFEKLDDALRAIEDRAVLGKIVIAC